MFFNNNQNSAEAALDFYVVSACDRYTIFSGSRCAPACCRASVSRSCRASVSRSCRAILSRSCRASVSRSCRATVSRSCRAILSRSCRASVAFFYRLCSSLHDIIEMAFYESGDVKLCSNSDFLPDPFRIFFFLRGNILELDFSIDAVRRFVVLQAIKRILAGVKACFA